MKPIGELRGEPTRKPPGLRSFVVALVASSTSDFETSRHYLAGLSQTHLPARRELNPDDHEDLLLAGVAVGFETMKNDVPIIIGEREDWGSASDFGISVPDQRRHMYIIGKTGSGKTTLLRQMSLQHIQLGHGLGVIDPHGDLAEELLRLIPAKRADDLVYFNPADLEFPVSLNLLANVVPDERHLMASGIVTAFKGIWRESWGPRLEYILYNALAALLDCQNVSLLSVNQMLVDSRYRDWVLRQVKDPFIKSFWTQEYALYDPRFQREAIAPIQNKLGQFLLNPVIRNMLGQVKRKLDIRFAMDNRQLFIANLSKGRLGEEKANLLGSLLVAQFQLGALARANRPEELRPDFHLVIDEFQNFSTDAFAPILAEARKYRLCLILSHQYIDQLPLPVRQAVFGNVGTLISFRVGHSDAELLAKEFGDTFAASTLSDLDRYEAAVKLLDGGTNKTPFLAKMHAPVEVHTGGEQKLIARSRERFATPRAVVEGKLKRWMATGARSPLAANDNSSPLFLL